MIRRVKEKEGGRVGGSEDIKRSGEERKQESDALTNDKKRKGKTRRGNEEEQKRKKSRRARKEDTSFDEEGTDSRAMLRVAADFVFGLALGIAVVGVAVGVVVRVIDSSCFRYLESAADRLVREAGLVGLDRVLQDDRVGAGGQLLAAGVASGRRGRHLEADDVLGGDAGDALHHAVRENLDVVGLVCQVVVVACALHSLDPQQLHQVADGGTEGGTGGD